MRLTLLHSITWGVCVALTLLLVGSSDTVEWPAVFFVLLLVGWSMFSQLSWRYQSYAPPRVVRFAVFALYSAIGGWRFSESKDMVHILSWALSGAVFAGSWGYLTEKGLWRFFSLLGFLALICLISSESFLTFVLFLFLVPAFLLLLNLSHLRFQLKEAGATEESLPGRYFLSLVSSLLLGFFVGATIFVLFPRSLQWQNPLALRSKESQSGYSGKIQLGASNIQSSSKIAFVVESDQKKWLAIQGPETYFRANALDTFDGKDWSISQPGKSPYISSRSIRQTHSLNPRLISARIFREEHSTQAVIYPGVLKEIRMPRLVQMQLRVDGLKNLERATRQSLRYSYDVAFSSVRLPSESLGGLWTQLQQSVQSPTKIERAEVIRAALEVPSEIKNTKWFSNFVLEAAPLKKKVMVGEVLTGLAKYFQTGFRAGYQGEAQGTKDLESFLSTTKYGHCEYFATATALALRQLGMPARVVLGYRGGAFNTVSQVLEVRESEAHAWVEYFLPDAGWIPLDTMPVTPLATGSELTRRFKMVYSAVRFWFERYLVDYNMETQRSVFSDLRLLPKTEQRKTPFAWRPLLVILVFLVLSISLYRFIQVQRKRHSRLPAFWRYFERRSVRWGISRRASHESFQSFAHRAQSVWPAGLADEVYKVLERNLYSTRLEKREPTEGMLSRLRKVKKQNSGI